MPRLVSSKQFQSLWLALVCACFSLCAGAGSLPTVPNLADKPIGSTIVVPANVILDLSVEFPTADSDAYYSIGTYVPATTYTGYFNPGYCYSYQKYVGTAQAFGFVSGYFIPQTAAAAHVCNGYWSGNFLNWALTQTIDPFRQTMTGGARIIDTTSLTVLQKAYSDAQAGTGNQQVKSLGSAALVSGATPFNWSAFYISNYHTGLNFVFSGSSLSTYPTAGIDYGLLVTAADKTKVYQAQGAVQVCTDGTSDTSRTCRAYGSNFKPVGLMQKYAAESTSQVDSIRYAAFGYLRDPTQNDNNQKMDGGVLRAKMKSVGPYQANPGTVPVANGNSEWSASTGIFVPNPNASDASATPADASSVGGVTNSGVISYLNNFGFPATSLVAPALASTYKVYDPVGELYYAATRYYRNLGNLANYTSNAAVTAKEALNDNFPVITTWDDPIKYSCSANYIIGIGDIHTWNDADVPGAVAHSSYDVNQSIPDDSGVVDATKATNYIANLENIAGLTGGGSNDYIPIATLGNALIGSIGSPSGGWGASQNSFYMAGLAYDVHTRDIRPDILNKSKPVTVSTFWLDVMESNDYHEKNQFWLTAKYGGFDTSTTSFPSGYTEYAATPAALPLASWNSGSYKDDRNNLAPDQYFQAAKPTAMSAGLSSAFAKIQANVPTGTSTSLGLTSNTVSGTGDANYAASFGANWTGEVVGETIDQTISGGTINTATTVKWHASYWLPPYTSSSNPGITPLTSSTRLIATSSSPGSGNGVPFRIGSGNISSSEQSTLGATSTAQTAVLNYLRGDSSNETTNGGTFRPRGTVLGDITNSKLQVVSAPSFPYADAPLNPGYSAFVTANASRSTIVYVGANDGMLHAFDGSLTSATAGKELFAYVPSYLFNNNSDSTGNAVGIASLATNPLAHHFMVDAQATVNDIDFARTNGSSFATSIPSDWHSVLISGLGKGGMGFFALDVTNPSTITSESALASNVLWETKPSDYPHMGYSYGTPLVVKTKRWGWTVVLTSGYGNDDGKGYIYLVNPKDGTPYETLSTGVGSSTAPAGLTYVGGAIPNVADFTADALYAGDLLGNVWRVDLTSSTSTTIANFATLTDAGGTPQSVTTEPVIQADPTALTRYVFIGTGRLLADTDLVNSQQQTFYALNDGNNAAFSTISAPLKRTNLANNSTAASISSGTTAGVSLTASQKGYYIDLATYAAGAGSQASAERINIQPVAAAGVVAFAANLYGQDICSGGSSRIFVLNYNTTSTFVGNSLLTSGAGAAIASATVPNVSGAVTGLSIVSAPGGLQVLAGTSGGGVIGNTAGADSASLIKLNWREAPAAQ